MHCWSLYCVCLFVTITYPNWKVTCHLYWKCFPVWAREGCATPKWDKGEVKDWGASEGCRMTDDSWNIETLHEWERAGIMNSSLSDMLKNRGGWCSIPRAAGAPRTHGQWTPEDAGQRMGPGIWAGSGQPCQWVILILILILFWLGWCPCVPSSSFLEAWSLLSGPRFTICRVDEGFSLALFSRVNAVIDQDEDGRKGTLSNELSSAWSNQPCSN